MNIEKLREALETFIADDKKFHQAIASSTRTEHGSGHYAVELFSNGYFRILWSEQIGNKYQSKGVILRIPALPETIDLEDKEEWEEALWFYSTEYANALREALDYRIELIEARAALG